MAKTLDGIVLSDFVELTLGTLDCATIPDYIADKIEALDKDESVHIQRPTTDNQLLRTRLWRKQAWITDYARWLRVKEESALNRTIHVIAAEKREVIARHFSRLTGLPPENFYRVANAALKARNPDTIKKLCGLGMAELMEADAKLAEFQDKHKSK